MLHPDTPPSVVQTTNGITIHGIPYPLWIRMSYEERHAVDPAGWPMENRTMEQPQQDPTQAALSVLAVVPQVVQESAGETSRAQAALQKLRDFPVYTAEQIAIAGDILQHVNGEWHRIETRRTSITQPLLAAKRSIDSLFSDALSMLEEAEKILKAKIKQARDSIEAANTAAQLAAEQMLQQGDARGAALATQNLQPTQAPQGLTFRDVWEWRVVNASVLPREYLTPDTKKIAAVVKKLGNKANIPGVEITKGTGISAGRK
jgi:hypothetical protein